jgi:hypothetical protein
VTAGAGRLVRRAYPALTDDEAAGHGRVRRRAETARNRIHPDASRFGTSPRNHLLPHRRPAAATARQHKDRRGDVRAARTNRPADADAVETRQHDVEKNQIERGRARHLERLFAERVLDIA